MRIDIKPKSKSLNLFIISFFTFNIFFSPIDLIEPTIQMIITNFLFTPKYQKIHWKVYKFVIVKILLLYCGLI